MTDEPEEQTPLQRALSDAGVTITQLAQRTNVTYEAARAWVNEGTIPSPANRIAIERALNLEAGTLFEPGNISLGRGAVNVVPRLGDIGQRQWTNWLVAAKRRIWVSVGSALLVVEGQPDMGHLVQATNTLNQASSPTLDKVEVRICCANPDSEHTAWRDTNESTPDGATIVKGALVDRVRMTLAGFHRILTPSGDGGPIAEIRMHDAPWTASTYVFDDVVVTYPYITGLRGIDTPTTVIDGEKAPNIAQPFVDSVERVWEADSTVTYTNGGGA